MLSKPYPYPGLRNVLIKLPNNQEVFLKEILHNNSYVVGICNQELTDCCIYNNFRRDKEEDICVLMKKQVWNPNEFTQDIIILDPYNLELTDTECKIKYPEIKYVD